jgi:hypothetical protein
MQLSQRVRARDIEEFFSSVGQIKDVKLIMCNKTRRFKGIAYVEYREIESVGLVSSTMYVILVISLNCYLFVTTLGFGSERAEATRNSRHRATLSGRKEPSGQLHGRQDGQGEGAHATLHRIIALQHH